MLRPKSTNLLPRTAISPLVSLPYILALTAALFIQHAFPAEQDLLSYEDTNNPRLGGGLEVDVGYDAANYEPDFTGADRSIIGRADQVPVALGNNAPGIRNISQGESHYWNFPSAALSGPKSPQISGLPSYFEGQNVSFTPNPGEVELYISLTTCQQPLSKDPSSDGPPDQLKLYVSTTPTNQQPDEINHDSAVSVEEGFGWLHVSVKNDVYFGVYAPANEGYNGVYQYQLTASIDGFYASSYSDPNIHLVDSDANSVLLYTNNTIDPTNSSDPRVQQWMDNSPVFSLFVQSQDDPSILGLRKSVCGLQNLAQIQGASAIEPSMTTAGDDLPKQQFYVKNLNRNSTYQATVAMIGNSTDQGSGIVGGGGTVWNSVIFTTKSFDNCALLFNLPFCTSVAYAAPANPHTFNTTGSLAQQYDQHANELYKNFSNSLQIIPCNTTSSAQYSLAKNCKDCEKAYRQWLCAVTIPRCEDISNRAPYLQPRAVNQQFINSSWSVETEGDLAFSPESRSKLAFNSSRNPMIDDIIRPGPYRELLPCQDICYNLTRSCPAALGFACPLEGYGLNYSYGTHHDDEVTCNSPWMSISRAASLKVMDGVAIYVALAAAFMVTRL